MAGTVHVQTEMDEAPPTRSQSMAESRNGDQCRQIYDDMMTKVCRGWLKEAIHRRDREAIERGLTELQAKTPRDEEKSDDPDVMLAEKMVRVLTVGDNLMTAVKENDIQGINQGLIEIRQKHLQHYLQNEEFEGRRALEMYWRKQKEKQSPLEMNKNTLSEIRRYSAPPVNVQKVMIAALLLLGEDEHTTQDWKNCQRLCNPYNKNSLVQRVAEFDQNLVNPEIAARAKQILDKLDFDQVRSQSSGAATFYVWARVILENLAPSLEGVTPANVDRQRTILGRPAIPGARTSPLLARRRVQKPSFPKYTQTPRDDAVGPGHDFRPPYQEKQNSQDS